ncbi:NAD(P)H-hydrate dehydratase [Lactobacillus sp. ESL0684]|uniref:NAD(P)H-hydrate dehydratase n=1 Tax=Lactobacillus sp. ESL0684 TaxID=2983213 RepID=UPI0023F8950D|nr:NAD(P)H-hydrate dehydratase [Lactobacillus sp. ESL0684]WEV44189.1 NAD(P)H-hydrate dehydratase [Lactobacillus sp. ESL0684]
MSEIKADILTKVIKKRHSATHKGDYGRVLLIGGNENYGGAIIMATEGALNTGAGLVAVATHSLNLTALHARDPEAMYLDWRDHNLASLIGKVDVVVCGPGLGTGKFAKQILQLIGEYTTSKQTLVLDANALDILAQERQLLPKHAGTIVLTPHQMEWQRLSGIKIPYQTDSANLAAFNELIDQQKAILVLKSNQTHVYDNQGRVFVNLTGNPGMATGGMGDTLAGIIGGFTAQFGGELDSVLAAVYLHSLAGDVLAQNNYVVKPTSLSELLPQLMQQYASK